MEEEYTAPKGPVAVYPIDDCPHVESIKVDAKGAAAAFLSSTCSDCGSKNEPWLCLDCGKVSCSRYVKGHAASHNDSSHHPISVSFSDFSVWCYTCESYIVDPALGPVLQALRYMKFEAPKQQEQDSYFLCNACYQKIPGTRFHCDTCPDYDLCENCHSENKSDGDHKSDHTCTRFTSQ